MLNNLLYLIDTNTISLMVTLFTMTVNKNNQLVLRFVQELGPLDEIKRFFSDNAYIAVKESEYQSKTSEFVKSVLPITTQSYIVSAVKNNEEYTDLAPFAIRICKNKAIFSKKKKPVGDNDYVVIATLNYANVRAQNDILTIITGDSKNCRLYEFDHFENASYFDISKLPREKVPYLYNVPVVEKKKHLTVLGDEIISYKRAEFDNIWRKRTLALMGDFFLSDEEKLIPRLDGSWHKEYVIGQSFPYTRYFDKIPNKAEWEEFLNRVEIFPISLDEIKKAG